LGTNNKRIKFWMQGVDTTENLLGSECKSTSCYLWRI